MLQLSSCKCAEWARGAAGMRPGYPASAAPASGEGTASFTSSPSTALRTNCALAVSDFESLTGPPPRACTPRRTQLLLGLLCRQFPFHQIERDQYRLGRTDAALGVHRHAIFAIDDQCRRRFNAVVVPALVALRELSFDNERGRSR